MLLNIHGVKTDTNVSISASGDNTVIAAITNGEIFIHELIGSAAGTVTLTIKCGARVVGTFQLQAGQGLTLTDVVGDDGVSRFVCYQGEAFILNLSGAVAFTGSIQYSYKT
jgi:hypothetical protein